MLDDADMFINMLARCRAVLSYMESGPQVTDPGELQLALAEKLRGDHTTLPDFLSGLRTHLEDPSKVCVSRGAVCFCCLHDWTVYTRWV